MMAMPGVEAASSDSGAPVKAEFAEAAVMLSNAEL